MSNSTTMAPDVWPLDRLKPYENNPRVITSAAVEKVVASILEFGWAGQFCVADASDVTIIGHTRHRAAKEIHARGHEIPGWPDTSTLPVIVRGDLSEEQARALRLMDNRSHEEATWDDKRLAVELGQFSDLDIELSGFELPEIDTILGAVQDLISPPPPAAEDDAASNPVPAETESDADDPEAVSSASGDPEPSQPQYDTQATIGEYRFPIERADYDTWLEDIRQSVGFEKADIVAEIRRRLGLPL